MTAPPIETAFEAVLQAYNSTSIARENYQWFGALFGAIAQASPPHNAARTLARLGGYLASDLGNLADCQAEVLDTHLNALRALRESSHV